MSSYIIIDSNSNSETYNFNIDTENTIINIPKTIGYTTIWDYSINRKWDIYSNSSLVNSYSNINNNILIGSTFNYNIYYFNDFNDINLQISNLDNQYNNVEYQNYTISIIFNHNITNINNYSINYNSDENGFINSVIYSLTYSNIFYLSNITTTPYQYYIFDSYTIEPNVIINNDSFIMPNSNITITANFIQNDFFIYYNSNQNGSIYSSISNLTYSNIFYLSNITTTPDQYYIFDSYTIEPNVIINNDSFIMPNSNITITANFIQNDFFIYYNSNQNGSIYSSISNLTYSNIFYLSNITTTPDQYYIFDSYTIEPNVIINNDSFIMPNSNITITANFIQNDFFIYYNSNQNGSIYSSISNLTYSNIFYLSNITTTPDQYYIFDSYTIEPNVIINNDSFIMPNSNITITAIFYLINYEIQFNSNQNGSIYSTISNLNYQDIFYLSNIEITSNIGYEFDQYTFTPNVIINNDSFIMPNSNIIISPNFNLINYQIIFSCNNGIITSSISNLNYQDIFYLSNITNIPDQYYKFDQYTFTPNVIITNNSFSMPTHNINITGNFIISYYYMNFNLIYATINQNIKQYIEENTVVTLPTIIPDPRYEFITWLSDDVSIVNNSFIMPSRDILISNRMERTKSLLTYNLDNGIIDEDTLITSYIIINTEVTLPSVSKYGFIFNGWQSTEFELLNPGDTFNIPDYDITVYALFTFEYNTGVNSIVITKNNLIYTTNTLGAVINKIDINNNFLLTKIAGSDEFSGLDDGFTGNDATFTFPRSIILTNSENELYLIDDNNIRNIKLVSDSIRGESIEIFTNVILTKSIFQNGGFGISKTNQENEICIINYNSRCIINTETLFIENKILITDEEQFIISDSDGTYEIIDIEFNTTDLYTYYNLRFPYYFKNLIANYKSQNNLTFPYYNLISEYPINNNNDELIFCNQIIEIETLDMDKLLNDKDFSISLFFNINQTTINSNIDINSNLIAHYKFDEINTQPEYIFKDETNNNYHLVNGGLNSPILENTEYIFGKSANFINNTDQWVKNDNINLTQSTFSISLWIKTVAHLNNSYIISQGDTASSNRLLYIGIESDDNNNTKYVFNSYNNNFGTQSIFYNDIGNDWVHLVFINNRISFNNNNRFIYRNGIKISSIYNINDFINSDNDSFNIGTRKDTNGTLQAYLDDLRIYNKVLTDTEIEKLYLMGENKNLLAYYKLNNLIDNINKLQNLIQPDGNIDFYNSTSNIFPVNQWANFTPTISKNFAITPDINKDIPLSFVFWFRYLSLDNYTIISYGDYDNSISSIDFDITNDSKLKIVTKLNNLSDQIIISPESPIFIDTWYHCVYTLNFSESIITKLYLNGSLKKLLSGYLPSGINTNTLPNYKNLVLGQNCNKTKSFHGNISELYIYNKELSITEINNLYNSYFNKYYTIIDFSNQLKIYYNLNIYNNISKFIIENNDKIIEYSIPNNNDDKFITYTFQQIDNNYDYLIDFYYDTHHIYNNNCNITININTIDDSIFNTSNVILGKNRNNKYPFNANIKDLRIYQKKLSPLEIKQIYNSKNIEIFEDNKHKYLIFQHIPFNYDTNNLLINYKFNNNLINHIYNNFDLIPLTTNYEFNVYESIINLDDDKFEINQFSNLNDDFTISFKYKYNNMETNNIILTNKDCNIDNDGFDITLYNNILKINTSDLNIDFKIDNIYNSILDKQHEQKSNLIAHYKFDGNSDDSSGNNKDLTEVGTITYSANVSIFNKSVAYVSGTDYFETSNDGYFSPASFTISLWAKIPSGSTSYEAIASCRNSAPQKGWIIYVYNNELQIWMGANNTWNASITANFCDDTWKHLVITMSSNTLFKYINGVVQVVNGETKDYERCLLNNIRIGEGGNEGTIGDGNSWGPLRDGSYLDDFRIYDRVLSATEVEKLYNAQYIQRKSINDEYDYIIFKNNGMDQTQYIIDILEDIYCDILVVGGGGGGGKQIGGGGGGGAVIYCSQSKLNKGSYSIGIGNGGEEYNKGYISYIYSDTIQIIADGGGTSAESFGDNSNGSNGGSGGGASADGADGSPYPIGGLKSNISKLIGISGIIYGNNGGDGYIRDGNNIGGGGGGGAGENGQNGNELASGTYSNGGKGGNGIQIDIIGTTYYWGGGGGGASYSGKAGNGGKGGGGGGAVGDNADINNIGLGGLEGYNTGLNGGNNGIGGDGAAHTGGGGGGGNWVNCKGGKGGSGIVIIKYKKHINNFNLYTIIFKNLSNTVDFYFNNQYRGNYSNIQLNSTDRNFNIGNLSGHLSDFRIYKNITSNIDIEYNFNNYFTDYTIDFKESLNCDILLIGSGGPSVSITETILTKFDFYSNIIVNYKLESNLNDETSNYNLVDNYLSNETYPSISVLPINLVNNLKNYENINFAFNYNPEFKRSDILYNFKYFQFTSCDKIGYLGPTLEECRNYYNNIYFNNNSYFSNINGYQLWTVPETSYYSIHAYGANSINSNFYQGGKGAYINSEFFLMKDEQLLIVVGQQGSNINSGSGASFVVKGNDYSISTNNDILLIAGGAGGIGNLSTNSFTFEFELLPLSTNLFYVISGNDRNGDIYNMENPYITIFLGDSLKITNNTGGHKFAIGTFDNNIIIEESNSNNIINWTPLETGNFKYWCISHPLHMFSTIYVLEKTKYFEFFDNSYSSINLFSETIHSETIGKKDIQENLIGGGAGFNYNGEINSNLDTEGKSFINGALGGFPNGGFGGGASSISKTAGGGGGFIGGNSGHFINNYGNKYFNGSGGYSYNNGTLLNFTPAGNYFNFASVIIHKQDIVLFKTIKYNINKLYDFNTYTFTTCGKIGNIGPTLNDCLNYYSNFHYIDNSLIYNYDWIYNENYFNMAQSNNTGYQLWTVPETATYYIEAHGACGGWLENIYSTSNFQFKGTPGTTIKSEYNLEIGEKIMILVGQSGGLDYNQNLSNINAGGGGGASFVVKGDTFHNLNTTDNVLLVAAGGGGPGTYITDGIFDYSNENTSNISLKTPIKTVLDFANLKFINSFMLSIVLKKQLKIVKNYLRHKLNLPNGLLTGGGILNNGLTKDGIINNGLYTNYLNIYGKAFIYGAIGGGYNQFESNIVNYGGFGGGSSSINKIGGGGGGFIGGNSGIYTNNNNEHLYFAGSSGYSYSKNNIYQLDINHINNNDIILNQNYITRNYPNGEGKVIITKITNTSNNELRIQVNLNTFLFKIDDTEFYVPYFNSSNSLIWSINSNGNWNFNINNCNINNDIIQPINIDTYDYGIILNNFSINSFLIYDTELTDSQKSVISIELINKTYNLPRYGNHGYNGYFKKISNKSFNGKYDIQISDGGKAHINNSYSVTGNDTFIKNDIFNETLVGAITHDTINYNNNPQINYYQDLINRDLLGSDIFFNNEVLQHILNSNLSFSNIGIGGLNSSKYFYDYSDIKGHDASSGLIIIKMDKYSNLPFISIDQKSDRYYINKICKSDFNNIFIENDVKINYQYNIDEILGITFNKNNNDIILTAIIENQYFIMSGYNFDNQYYINNVKESKFKIKTLMDYDIIYNDKNTNYFIGKSSDTDKLYYISYDTLIIDNENPNVISFSEQHEIYDYGTGSPIFVPVKNIIYSNKYITEQHNRLLYYDDINNKILFLNFYTSLYKTTTLKLDYNFVKASKITINNDDSELYVSEYSNIYNISLINTSLDQNLRTIYNVKQLHQSSNIINALTYKNNKLYYIDNILHSIDNDYLNSNLFNNYINDYSNIQSSIDTENFNNLTDFVIDINNEIGYLTFESKIKWFYIK